MVVSCFSRQNTRSELEAAAFADPEEAIDKTAFGEDAAATIGTPDDLVDRIRSIRG
jgi:hypothetical protein